MLRTYYTYRALSLDWHELLHSDGAVAIYTSRKNELSIELASGSVVVFGSRGPFTYLFRSEASGRPRRNVMDLLGAATGARFERVSIAERDRVVSFHLADEREIRMVMFGSRPNVLLVDGGVIADAFKDAGRLTGKEAPATRAAPRVEDLSEFLERARRANTPEKAVSAAFRLFDRVLAREVLHLSQVRDDATVEEALEAGDRLFENALEIERRVGAARSGRVYRLADGEIVFSLIPLSHLVNVETESFEDVDSAVSACTRMMLRQMRFDRAIGPVRRAVDDRVQRSERRLREVGEHLERPGRADEMERRGHLLMASGRGSEQGLDRIDVPDHFGEGERVSIPLDPALTVMQNAERYYDRARRSRASRESASERLERARREVARLQEAARALGGVVDMDGLHEFRRSYSEWFTPGDDADPGSGKPFRRYQLAGGYEVWIGRNARENDELTFGHARKFDIWMHARGVGGSHVVLRLPSRTAKPGAVVLEAAASAAAYYSKARGSEFVPVMYTERKYVRKVRGGDPGKVVVEREEVLIVPPALPRN